MNCPVCRSELQALERQGIEIDVCSRCRGVWFDRGELDKLLERAAQHEQHQHQYSRRHDRDDDSGEYEAYNGRDQRRAMGHYPPQQRKSFWSRLFDD